MKKIIKPLLISIIAVNAIADSDVKLSVNGSSGLFENPNARVMEDWKIRLFDSFDTPYNYYGLVISPLPFVEFNLHSTDTKYQKDKSLNMKLLLIKEGKYMPSLAFGVDNIWGNTQLASKYIALSKRVSYFDFTLGYAKGRLGGEDISKYYKDSTNGFNFIKNSNWSNGKIFVGFEFFMDKYLSFIGEYNNIDYNNDNIKEKVNSNSKFNFGIKYKITKDITTSLLYQKGDELSFAISYEFGFKEKSLPKSSLTFEKYNFNSTDKLEDNISKELEKENFKHISTKVDKNKIFTQLDSSEDINELKLIGRAFKVISKIAPNSYNTLYVTRKKQNIPLNKYKVFRKELNAYKDKLVSDKYMIEALDREKDNTKISKDDFGKEYLNYIFTPTISSFIYDNRENNAKVNLIFGYDYLFSKGLLLTNTFNIPIYNNLKPIDNSYKMREFEYENSTEFKMENLTFDYIVKLQNSNYIKTEIGHFNNKYSGVNIEWFKPMFEDKFGIGLEYQYVYQRVIDSFFDIEKENFSGKFINIYYYLLPLYNIHLNIKAGEFLAKDRGVRFDIARHYKNYSIGLYSTFTESDLPNSNYIDKGIYIKIPIDIFTKSNLKEKILYNFSPIHKDIGSFAKPVISLYDMLNSEDNLNNVKRNIYYLK